MGSDLTRIDGNGLSGAQPQDHRHFNFGRFFQLTVGVTVIRIIVLFFAALLAPAQAAEYVIDPTHTYASFEIDHLGFSTQRGQFNRSSGIVEFDPEGKTGRIDITIDAASLDTGFALRDDVLRGDQWQGHQQAGEKLARYVAAHLNGMAQENLVTDAPIVGVALTSMMPIAGSTTGATQIMDIEAAARFVMEVAKGYTAGHLEFYDAAEFEKIVALYGSMRHLRKVSN